MVDQRASSRNIIVSKAQDEAHSSFAVSKIQPSSVFKWKMRVCDIRAEPYCWPYHPGNKPRNIRQCDSPMSRSRLQHSEASFAAARLPRAPATPIDLGVVFSLARDWGRHHVKARPFGRLSRRRWVSSSQNCSIMATFLERLSFLQKVGVTWCEVTPVTLTWQWRTILCLLRATRFSPGLSC